jgi:3-hydroxy-9,10-secoandrosta-1,3,5(10)-triene-9,17-dione monooxygenase reductase component
MVGGEVHAEQPVPQHDERHFRSVLGHFATGVAVVTGIDRGEPVGMTVQAFCSLSIDPPLILLCPALSSTTWPRLEREGKLLVNLLSAGQEVLARQFARSGTDKYRGVRWMPSSGIRAPILEDALAWIECELEAVHPGGDHLIAVCTVKALSARTDLQPLVFFRSGFQGMSP